MKLLEESIKQNADKGKDGENVPILESVELVLVRCNLVKNDYQLTLKVLLTFVPNKQFGQLINISPRSLMMMSTVNAAFFFLSKLGLRTMSVKRLKLKIMSIWYKLLGRHYRNEIFKSEFRKCAKGYGFLSFARKSGDKYGKRLMDTANKTGIDATKTAPKRVVHKIGDMVTSVGKSKQKNKERRRNLHSTRKKTTNY